MAQCVRTKFKKKKRVVGGSGLVGVHLKDELLCEKLVNSRRGSPSRVIKAPDVKALEYRKEKILLIYLFTSTLNPLLLEASLSRIDKC